MSLADHVLATDHRRYALLKEATDVTFGPALSKFKPVYACLEAEKQLEEHLMTGQEDAMFQSFEPTPRHGHTKDGLTRLLLDGAVAVRFTKEDGTETEMCCTLRPDLIPEADRPKAASLVEVITAPNPEAVAPPAPVNTNPLLIKAYALDRKGWRSFRLDRILHVIT
jgi:hypothetical protein